MWKGKKARIQIGQWYMDGSDCITGSGYSHYLRNQQGGYYNYI